MKQAALLFAALISLSSFSQEPPTSPSTQKVLINRAKSQKTTAIIFLAGGSVATIAGVAAAARALDEFVFGNNSEKYSMTAGILTYSGLALMAGSIPLFIAAGKNRSKAIRLSLNTEKAIVYQRGFVAKPHPALSIHIKL